MNPEPEPDEQGNAWRQWLEAESHRFLLYARSRTACDADAEDVLQEALVETWRRTGGHRAPDAALVFATIRRRALDQSRRRRRRERREHAAALPGEPPPANRWFDPLSPAESADTCAILESAIRALPAAQQEVVILKFWGGLTFAQIADFVGCPPNTAASRYRYGLETLRRSLTTALA